MVRTHKLLGLEVVRFLSALAILIAHYKLYGYTGSERQIVAEHQPFYSILWPVYEHGSWGVPVFWCVSGFVMTWKYHEAIATGAVDGWRFFVLRMSRLYPLHFATLLIVAALQHLYFQQRGAFLFYQDNTLYNFVLQLFMASNWGLQTGSSFNFPIWSISVEVLVYAMFFLLLRHAGTSAMINVTILAACVAAKWLRIWHPIVDCLAFFYVGGLSAMTFIATRRLVSVRVFDALAIVAVVVSPLAVLLFRFDEHRHFAPLFFMFYTPVLLFVAARDWRCSERLQKIIEACGTMTYSSYLLHFPIQLAFVVTCDAFAIRPPVYSATFWLASFAVILTASRACYVFLELPAQESVRRRLLYSRTSTRGEVSAT
jgi:peptidoglycan/LPS O-acetylase OafA/YrhL